MADHAANTKRYKLPHREVISGDFYLLCVPCLPFLSTIVLPHLYASLIPTLILLLFQALPRSVRFFLTVLLMERKTLGSFVIIVVISKTPLVLIFIVSICEELFTVLGLLYLM